MILTKEIAEARDTLQEMFNETVPPDELWTVYVRDGFYQVVRDRRNYVCQMLFNDVTNLLQCGELRKVVQDVVGRDAD